MALITWQDMLDRSMGSYKGRLGHIVQNPVEAEKAFIHFLENNAKKYAKLPKAAALQRMANLINVHLTDNKGKFIQGPGAGSGGIPRLERNTFIKK